MFGHWRKTGYSKSSSREKILLILSKEDFGWVVKYFFAFFERSASCSNQNRSRCLFGRCVSSLVGFACLKIPPHSSKGKIEGCIGKNFLLFERICALPKQTRALLCRRTGAYMADNKRGASPFVWRCPLSLFNAAQFLRWVCCYSTY